MTDPPHWTPHLVQLPADGRSDLEGAEECEEDAEENIETPDDESGHANLLSWSWTD